MVGIRKLVVLAPERGVMLNVTAWYPARAGGTAVTVGDNAVFQGAPARQDAPIADGSYPLILLSHGGLRSAPDSGAWIASRLAAQGFVVAEPSPPRLEREHARDAPNELWLRPADLSATLRALGSDPTLRTRLDAKAIGVLGFQLGGTAALGLVGARINGQLYARSCDPGRAAMDCTWFARNGIDLHGVDIALAERSNIDRRVRAAIAVDPELSEEFDPASSHGDFRACQGHQPRSARCDPTRSGGVEIGAHHPGGNLRHRHRCHPFQRLQPLQAKRSCYPSSGW